MAFKLTDGQKIAIERCIDWYYTESYTRNYYVCCGYSGTGKSTVVHELIRVLGLSKYQVLYVCPTGKATLVLRLKVSGGVVQTIHKAFYSTRKGKGGKVFFNLKQNISPTVKLIVVDEAGMCPNNMVEDVLSFNVPVIMLGDDKQLPAIFQKNTYMDDPHSLLTQIMRTDDASGIIYLGQECREERYLVPGVYGRSRVTYNVNELDPLEDYDMVICWTNKMRQKLNFDIRSRLGYAGRYPKRGEKVICLANRYDYEITYNDIPIYITNGLVGVMLEDATDNGDETVQLKFRPEFIMNDDLYFDVPCHKSIFDGYYEQVEKLDAVISRESEKESDVVFCDFGYTLSCHKSQGSEAPTVLYVEEAGLRQRPEYFKHIYTGITRGKYRTDVLLSN